MGGKLAQLLSDVLVTAHPHLAQVSEETKHRVKDEWLEGLERHATKIVSPIIDQVLAASDMDPQIAELFEHAARPKAQFGATVQQFFVFGVMFTLANAALQPFIQEIQNDLWKANPDRPLSPADVATALTQAVEFGDTQGVDVPGWALDEAAMSGINNERFKTMVGIDGQAPDGTDLFEMFRRGIIDSEQLQNGFLEGPTKNKWIPYLTKLQYTPLTIASMVRAAVQNQLDYSVAEDLAHKLGLEPAGWVEDNPDWFKIAFDIEGRPPGPQEMGRMANRGIIPWNGTGPDVLSFEQGIAESDVKTKWTPALQAIEAYFPPPEETRSLYVSGGISLDQAKKYWQMAGIPADLITAFAHRATIQQTETERALSKGETLKAYFEGIIDRKTALALLAQIGYSGQTATYIVELTDQRRLIQNVNKAVNRVATYYVGYKMTATDAQESLHLLGLPDEQIKDLLTIWEVERTPEVRLPTTRELGNAVKYGGLDFDTAVAKTQLLGYTAFDATVIISGFSQQPPTTWPPDTDTGVDV